jgi:type I restriction enzyme M protein
MSDWGGDSLRKDKRWEYGKPPVNNANFAWVQHFIHHLSPNGTAGFVLANGSMSSNTSGEGDIRKAIIEADLVDCMVALPGQLFYSTQIPVCLWFLSRSKAPSPLQGEGRGEGRISSDRRGRTLFIDARKLGTMINRRNKELTNDDIALIADTYHAWRNKGGQYEYTPGFCKAATLAEVRSKNYVLMPGRYVGTEEEEDDGIPFEDQMNALTAQLAKQLARGSELEQTIRENVKRIGYEF